MINISQESLMNELKKLNLDPQIQAETNQIYVIIKHEKHEFPLFIRLLHDGELIQILMFVPTNIKKESSNDLARFLHMVNKELDMPGFCFDEQTKTVFYRLMLPSFKQEVSEEIFAAYMNTTQMVTKTFAAPIVAIANGLMTLDEVMKKAQKQTQAQAPK